MFLSVFDLFKVGIGPSSSHTMGPMRAAERFLALMRQSPFEFGGIKLRLHGSCLLYTSPSPRDRQKSRMPSSA